MNYVNGVLLLHNYTVSCSLTCDNVTLAP